MPISNPLDILLAHNHWATRNLLDTCATLTPEQFHRKFEIGLGSLHDTIRHILWAMRLWTDVLHQRPVREPDDNAVRTVAELLIRLDQTAAAFNEVALAHPLDGLVTRERLGKVSTYPRGGILTQVTTHGVHHRAQCMNMLRHLGVAQPPQNSVIEWMRAVDPVL